MIPGGLLDYELIFYQKLGGSQDVRPLPFAFEN